MSLQGTTHFPTGTWLTFQPRLNSCCTCTFSALNAAKVRLNRFENMGMKMLTFVARLFPITSMFLSLAASASMFVLTTLTLELDLDRLDGCQDATPLALFFSRLTNLETLELCLRPWAKQLWEWTIASKLALRFWSAWPTNLRSGFRFSTWKAWLQTHLGP